jgi:hypothetical protein
MTQTRPTTSKKIYLWAFVPLAILAVHMLLLVTAITKATGEDGPIVIDRTPVAQDAEVR